jgi:hypothetical protein
MRQWEAPKNVAVPSLLTLASQTHAGFPCISRRYNESRPIRSGAREVNRQVMRDVVMRDVAQNMRKGTGHHLWVNVLICLRRFSDSLLWRVPFPVSWRPCTDGDRSACPRFPAGQVSEATEYDLPLSTAVFTLIFPISLDRVCCDSLRSAGGMS